MSLLINILIIVIIAVIVILILNHFFFQTNILYDKLIKAQTVKGDGIGSVTTLVYPPSNSSFPNINNVNTSNPSINTAGTGISGTFIPHTQMPTNSQSSNFMFSIWFFIDNYTTNLGKYKKIASIIGTSDNTISGSTGYAVSLDVTLDEYENNLLIGINNTVSSSIITGSNAFNAYNIQNVPLQKWNCLIISVNNRTMDVYLEGKLINSYILEGYYKPFPNSTIWLGNNSSNYYDGYLTRVRYQASSITPEEAYTIYKEGINSSLMGDFLNKYRLKVGFYEYDTEKAQFTI